MVPEVHLTRYGRDATQALGDAVARAKRSPLDPLTVVVASNFAGLAARRALGSSTGLVNVSFVTAFRLAELLAADLLLDRRPLTNPVLGAAVRLALAEDPGRYRGVEHHVATETALRSLYADLSNLSSASLRRLATEGGPDARSAAAFHRRIATHLEGFHDEAALAAAAAARADLAEALAPFGHIVWYLPAPTTAPLVELMRKVLAAAPSTVLIGTTGHDQADGAVRRMCARAEVAWPSRAEPAEPPTADRVISVTDADEEVRAVVRNIATLATQGVRLDRVGVFYPTPDPYVRLLEQHLAAADIPANGPSRRRLADSVAGRTLLAALHLPGEQWRRDRVMALVSGAPVRGPSGPARPTAWETTSRQAGVVQGLADWYRKLDSRRSLIERRVADGASVGERELTDLGALREFVESLAAAVDAVHTASSWTGRSTAAQELLRGLLGPGTHPTWPEEEQEALERVEDALIRLSALDELEPRPSFDVFLRALRAELDVTRGRRGRFGEGVVYGPLVAAVGQDLDAVFLLGCAEGLCPVPRREDPLLSDAARRLTDGELELRRDGLDEQHRWFLAALASAPQGQRVLTFPRGDLRSGREALPSRWLLDSVSALVGTVVHSTDFPTLDHPSVDVVASHVSGLRVAPEHATVVDRDLVLLERHAAAGGDVERHPLASPVQRGLAAQRQRRSSEFTEWDGNVVGQPITSTDERPLSPTRLESWAACGFRYFLQYVLGLADRDDPERVLELSPLDRGSGVHEALEDFFREVIEHGAPGPDEPWTTAHHERLRTIAEEKLDDYERRGRTGRPVHWQLTRTELLALLDEFLHHDDAHRAATRSIPEQVELPFGLDGAEPVTLTLPDGRALRFRGKADRVDRGEDGRTFVSDYKTGKGSGYTGLADDPVQGGTTLQLGLYAEAARQHLGADRVEAHYWMVNEQVGFVRRGYPWTDDRRERFMDVLTAIVDGIEGGVFPAAPGEWNNFFRTHANCRYCAFDTVCVRDRGEHAELKSDDPVLLASRAPLAVEEQE